MNIEDLMKKESPKIPEEMQIALSKNEITPTLFCEKNDILKFEKLQKEVGYKKMEDGSYLVSMYCPMPQITSEMIEWWFWWHPKKNERYQVWFPEAHFSIGFSKKQADYFECENRPRFQNNTQYPVEKIGGVKMPLRIDFVNPEEFGLGRL